VPHRAVAKAPRDEAPKRAGASERGKRVEGQVAGRRAGSQLKRKGVGRRVFLVRVASVVQQRRERKDLRSRDLEDGADIPTGLQEGGIDVHADREATIRQALTVPCVVAQLELEPAECVIVRAREDPGESRHVLHVGLVLDPPPAQPVPFSQQRGAHDPVGAGIGNRELEAEAPERGLIRVARLFSRARLRTEPVEPAREGLLVARPDFEKAPLFLEDPAARRIALVEPPPPGQPIRLLALDGVRREEPREFSSALRAKIEIGDCDPAAESHIGVAEEERSDEARDEKPLEDVARLESPLRDVAPAFGMGQIVGLVDLRNPAILVDSLPRIEIRLPRLCGRRSAEQRDGRGVESQPQRAGEGLPTRAA